MQEKIVSLYSLNQNEVITFVTPDFCTSRVFFFFYLQTVRWLLVNQHPKKMYNYSCELRHLKIATL